MEIPKSLSDSVWDYCRLNNITDVNGFTIRMITQGFNIEKYGNVPTKIVEPEIIEKEVIKYIEKEVIKEVPVEVIKYIEKEVIKEVPVGKVVNISDKNEPIIKEVKVVDQDKIDEYERKIQSLMYQLSNVTKNLNELEVEYTKVTSFTDIEKISKLENKIKNLQIELELEKNRHLELPKHDTLKDKNDDVVRWVSRDKDKIYGDE